MAVRTQEDLATLSELDEKSLLESLSNRFQQNHIYTYIGDILVAINPFKYLPLYEKTVSEKYKCHEKGDLPPHIFAVADRAYQSMLGRLATGPRNQCIVISGESGAGKTESTKLLLRQIMELCKANSQLEQQILQVNPLLEAFGNAQTVMNDNSSRFGKYIQLRFQNSSVKSAKINEYLLEKSRVVHQDEGERNFHIFYCMLAGISAEDKEMYGLLDPDLYRYINGKYGSPEMVNKWSTKYNEVCNAMDMVGFEEQEQVDMKTILAGILSLGNIKFEPQETGILKATEQSNGWLKAAAGQFGVQEEELVKCLICTTSVTRGESIKRNHSQQQAEDARDSIAKVAYGRVFGWIVSKINELLAPNVDLNEEHQEIGILDIFGFENFAVNRYEQLCINLANEQLQYFFNHHIFLMEQKEYKEEGIKWETITFKDNKPILDLFLAKPFGIFSLLDEQSAFPKATDTNFVDKLNSNFKGKPHFEIVRSHNPMFTVVHYAGKVQYNASGFLEKNRDTIPANIRGLFINSVTPLLSVLFAATISRTGTLMPQRRAKLSQAVEDNFNSTRKQSVGAQFKHSLTVLMEKMFAANPHFIRCVKPNASKQPDLLDSKVVMDQLRYNGLLETIRIRRDGFSWRPSFEEFAQRYRILLIKPDIPLNKERAQKVNSTPDTVLETDLQSIMQSCLCILNNTDLKDWKCGSTRFFFKYWHQEQLAKCIDRLGKAATVIQKMYRGFCCKKKYVALVAEMRLRREQEMRQLKQEQEEEEKRRQLEIEQLEMEQENQSPPTAPVPFPRKRKPQPRPRSIPAETLQPRLLPPVPRPRSKLLEATPFDNDLENGTVLHMNAQEEAEAKQRWNKRCNTIRWFKETQARKVVRNGAFPNWFHGMITRRQAEDLMTDKSLGCFLIRVSESREGYTLTFRGKDRCRHYMIEMQTNGKYVILGEARAHPSLLDLIEYHKKVGILPFLELLTVPCGQRSNAEPDYEELKNLMLIPSSLAAEEDSEPSEHSSSDPVHLELLKLFAPLDQNQTMERQVPPVLKRISEKKLKTEAKESQRNCSEDHEESRRSSKYSITFQNVQRIKTCIQDHLPSIIINKE
ncbi:myosin-IIIb-like isoform X1 [Huso huso]|uniref:non-specific serine/threonine protein kinase n=1 Tax=Huso huso TaxID=61971 RepID=A0ABR1A6G8_HUSHU